MDVRLLFGLSALMSLVSLSPARRATLAMCSCLHLARA